MPYRRVLKSGLVIASTAPGHAAQLERLQEVVFPTLAPEQRFRAPHYFKHIELFPEGQFVGLDGDTVVAMTSTVRLDFDFEHFGHGFDDIIQGGWMTSHQPGGSWLYGADIGTRPDYRHRGLARGLYAARHETVRSLGLAGQVTVGMMSGFGARKNEMSAQEYYEGLKAGRIVDPTISAQMRIGFQIGGLIPDYLHDPVCDNYGVCLVLDAAHEVRPE
ncbi:MAG: GNAT family N-acetyltransferase [Candidatus Wallbacteria bacterium]|nr:GNAT family N-acetyltransferase [Candidatus Wallbacteria bacterium]